MKMVEDELVEEYIKKAREIRNRLASMGETLMDPPLACAKQTSAQF